MTLPIEVAAFTKVCECIDVLRVRGPGVGQTVFENVETHENPA